VSLHGQIGLCKGVYILVGVYMQDSALYVECFYFSFTYKCLPQKQIIKKMKPNEIKNPKCDQKKMLFLLFILRSIPLSFKRERNELNMLYICVIGANSKNPTKIFHALI
jgi:hypothetical protein